MHKYVFLDTNVFEQFQPLANIDWLKLATCERVTLLVPSATINELNKHKDGTTRGRLKRRAADALIELRKHSGKDSPPEIRPGVRLAFRAREPLIDFGSYHLDRTLNDDRVIASAIEFAIDSGEKPESVLVATGDFGLELKVNSQPLISVLALPENLRLPDEPDAEESRIRKLETELQGLRNSFPKLTLAFTGNSNFTKVAISAPHIEEQSAVDSIIHELKRRHEYIAPSPGRPLGYKFFRGTMGQCQDYNNRLNEFFAAYQTWLRDTERVRNWYGAGGVLKLILSNDGGRPAENIDVELRIPMRLELRTPAEWPREGPEPIAPPLPDVIRRPMPQPVYKSQFGPVPPAASSDVRIETCETPDSVVVQFRLQRLKHTQTLELPWLYVSFRDWENAQSFGIQYRLLADNCPMTFEGTVHVAVEKSEVLAGHT